METYKCLIIDNETLAQELIEAHLSKIPSVEIVGKCHTAMQALTHLNGNAVDILFLDIQMPDLTGIELLKSLENPPLTIFTTAYSEYALEGYALNIVDYLLKPVRFDHLFKAVAKAQNLLGMATSDQKEKEKRSENSSGYIFVKSGYKAIKVSFEDIIFIGGMQKYVKFHLKDTHITSLMSLTKLEEVLPSTQFFRCQKSFIVNLSKIKVIDGNQLIMENETKVPVSKTVKAELVDLLDKHKLL